jgi:hypothetical protein
VSYSTVCWSQSVQLSIPRMATASSMYGSQSSAAVGAIVCCPSRYRDGAGCGAVVPPGSESDDRLVHAEPADGGLAVDLRQVSTGDLADAIVQHFRPCCGKRTLSWCGPMVGVQINAQEVGPGSWSRARRQRRRDGSIRAGGDPAG